MLVPTKRSVIKKAFRKKGFEVVDGGDHIKLIFYYDGKKTGIYTILSRGSGYDQYSKSLLGKMSRQLNLNNSQLMDFIQCPLSEADFIKIQKDKKHII
ncbi:MAG: hypothetical protein WD491_09715 [Balneolales bacterium]